MNRLVLLAALLFVAVAAWIYLRSPSPTSPAVDGITPGASVTDAPRPATAPTLARPEDPVAREGTALPSVPAAPEPELVVDVPVPPPAIVPDAIELLKLEQERLRKTLSEISIPLLQRKYENGEGKYLGAEQSYKHTPSDNATIFSIVNPPDGGTYRVDISREERPDLYVMKDRTNAIDIEIKALLRDRARAAESGPK